MSCWSDLNKKEEKLKNYELTLIIDPNNNEKDIQRLQEELSNLLKTHGAATIWDIRAERRTFAYPIRKHREGTYLFIRFQAPPDLPEKVRQDLRHREEIMRLAFFALPHTPATASSVSTVNGTTAQSGEDTTSSEGAKHE